MTRDPRKRDYLIAEEAGPVAVPATAAISKNVWFVWRPNSQPELELKEGWYSLSILGWTEEGVEPDLAMTHRFHIDQAKAQLLLEFKENHVPTTRFVTFEGADSENSLVSP